MWPNPQETADLVIFFEEILSGKIICAMEWRVRLTHNSYSKEQPRKTFD